MSTFQKKLWFAIESSISLCLGLILLKLVTNLFFNTKVLNVLIDEIIDVLSDINRGMICMSVVHGVIDMGLAAFKALFQLLNTIGLNIIYNTLKLTVYILTILDVIMFIGWYFHFKNIMNNCLYYFNYYQYNKNQLGAILNYFVNKDKYYYCELNQTAFYYVMIMTVFIIFLTIVLGVLKIVKFFV